MSPAEIISAVLRESRDEKPAIAYTYSEPLVHAEFLLDCMSLARRHGIANVLVTNGCVNAEAATEILALTDAANIDLKCFSAQTYSKILGGNLDTVLEFIALAIKAGVHVEITTLAVPELNDSGDEMDAAAGFIAGLRDQTENGAAEIPWHLSAYHPDYRWNAPPTDPAFLLETARRARKLLPYVYTGNIAGEINNTQCRFCGETLVRREGYSVDISGLAPPAEGEKRCRCSRCKEVSPVVC